MDREAPKMEPRESSEYEAPEVEQVMDRDELGREVEYAANTISGLR